jgi:hypothetical protein
MKVKLLLAMISLSILVRSTFASEVEAVPLPPNVSHQAWETLLNWFKDDFDKAGGAKKILVEYAPQQYHDLLASGNYEISYLPYNWGLNDQSDHGKDYGRKQMIWDLILDFMQFWK